MKIVFLIDQIHKHGGGERVLIEKANYFTEKFGYEITIITTEQKNKEPRYDLINSVNIKDLAINYNRSISYFSLDNIKKGFIHYLKLKKNIKQIKPDFIILMSDAFDYYFLPFIIHKSKILKEFHSSQYNNFNKKKGVKYKINNYINNKYDYLILLNLDEKKMFDNDNTIVIPNSVKSNTNKIAKLTTKKVISAGRIAPVKGYESLINAWSIIAKEFPDWQLEIFGDGDINYINQLQKQINKLSLQNHVCLCGQTDDLENKMLQSSIYVMSSKTECFPMVLLEAQAVGLPLISFDCPYGPRNIITHNKNGILVENQNIKDLAKAIGKLILNEKLRYEMGKFSKENVKKFQKETVMNLWYQLFNKNNT